MSIASICGQRKGVCPVTGGLPAQTPTSASRHVPSPGLPGGGGQRARWRRLSGSLVSVSLLQASSGYNVAPHHQWTDCCVKAL